MRELWNSIVTEICQLPARELALLIRTREVSAVEVIDAFLQRIERVNPALNAIVQVTAQEARAEAQRVDARLAHAQMPGPLCGVPFTAKDVFDVAGVISAVGLSERSDFRPPRDATVITRMRASGAILLGKTNCPPGGAGTRTENPLYGRTSNPHRLDHSPGGSSGGEAAAVAAGLSALGLGADSGGSLRLPAHYCGVSALKPTTGRIPNTGAFGHAGPAQLDSGRQLAASIVSRRNL